MKEVKWEKKKGGTHEEERTEEEQWSQECKSDVWFPSRTSGGTEDSVPVEYTAAVEWCNELWLSVGISYVHLYIFHVFVENGIEKGYGIWKDEGIEWGET